MPFAAKPHQKIRSASSASKRGYGRDWQRLRDLHLASSPLCVECQRRGVVAAAIDVDHIRPHEGRDDLRLDPANLQSLCKKCHGAKTKREQGR